MYISQIDLTLQAKIPKLFEQVLLIRKTMEFLKIIFLLPILCSSKSLYELKSHSSIVDIPLVTFDGTESTTFEFHELNDPVMVSSFIFYFAKCSRI